MGRALPPACLRRARRHCILLASPGVLEQQGEEEPRVISQSWGGRAGGERSAARAAAAVRPHRPASGRSPRSGQPGWPGPSLPTAPARARPSRGDRRSAALRWVLRSAVSRRRVARMTAPGARTRQRGSSGADVPGRAQGFPEGTPCNRLLPKVLEHTSAPVRQSPNPQGSIPKGSTPRVEFKEGTTRCTSLAVHPLTGGSGAERHREGGGRRSWTTPGVRERRLDPASGLGRDLRELRGSRQGGGCLKGRTHPWPPGSWAH